MLKGALARVELAARFAADRPNRSKFDEQQANALRVPPPPPRCPTSTPSAGGEVVKHLWTWWKNLPFHAEITPEISLKGF